jgi:hypothetical protein
MKLHLEVHVKFRALGITFGHVDVNRDFPLPEITTLVGTRSIFTLDEHGVKVVLALVKA